MWDREKTKKKEIGKGSGWFSFKNSLQCKSEASDVHDPRSRKQLSSILTKKSGRSGCSRSISNLKDVIHGSKRHLDKPPTCSPRSIGSSEFLNPITHEVILSDSKCELKITGFGGFHDDFGCGGGGTFMGTLRPGTPGPAGDNNATATATATATTVHYLKNSATPTRKNSHLSLEREKRERNGSNRGGAATTCHKCGEHFAKWEALESHHLSKHAVTELVEGDSSRKIVEIICRSSWSKAESRSSVRIERVLKVHNMQKTLARFEDYREIVKIKASKLPKKHPRCLADGNELLRFYGTFVACSLGINGSSSLCVSDICCVCRIIRHGFSTKREINPSAGGVGIFTTSTSGRAFQSIDDIINPIPIPIPNSMIRKALIVCRVIAGRVHRPLENAQEIVGQTGFDSLAGKVGLHSNVEELYLLSPKALLPCFVVICKTTT